MFAGQSQLTSASMAVVSVDCLLDATPGSWPVSMKRTVWNVLLVGGAPSGGSGRVSNCCVPNGCAAKGFRTRANGCCASQAVLL